LISELPPLPASLPSQRVALPVIDTQKSSQELPFTPPNQKLVEARFVELAVVANREVVVAFVEVEFIAVKF